MAEVKLSKLAMDKGQSTEVKQFARKMVEDHTKANMELKQIAEKKSIAGAAAIDAKHQKVYDKLAKLDGRRLRQGVHARDGQRPRRRGQAVQGASRRTGRNPELKSFAMKTLPIIEKHDDMAHMDRESTEEQKQRR